MNKSHPIRQASTQFTSAVLVLQLLFTLLVAGMLASPAQAQHPARRAEARPISNDGPQPRLVEEKSGAFPARNGERLRLTTDVGNIRIRTQNTAQVSYRVRIETNSDPPDARRILNQFVVVARNVPDGVNITARVLGRDARARLLANFEVSVPRDFQLDVSSQAGNIQTEDIDGRISFTTGGGSLIAGRVGSAARLETEGGHITVQDVDGDLTAITGGGHISAGNVQGDAVIRTSGGHIRLLSVKGVAQLETGGGNIFLQRAGANVIANTAGGRIDLGETRGGIRARTGGGSIGILSVAGATELESTSGSICLTKVQGSIRASTSAGTITAWFIPEGKLRGPSQLQSQDGDIVVYLPRDLALTIDATLASPLDHQIDADPAMAMKVITSSVPSSGRVIRGEAALNGGGEVLHLKAGTGNIRLRFSDSTAANIQKTREAIEQQLNLELQKQQEMVRRQLDEQKEYLEQQRQNFAEQVRQQMKTHELTRMEELQRWFAVLMSRPVRMDPLEQQARLIRTVEPRYPAGAREIRVEGVVHLEVRVNKEGGVEDVRVISGHPLLNVAAEDAVKQWRYAPALVDGKPVPVVTSVDVVFRLH